MKRKLQSGAEESTTKRIKPVVHTSFLCIDVIGRIASFTEFSEMLNLALVNKDSMQACMTISQSILQSRLGITTVDEGPALFCVVEDLGECSKLSNNIEISTSNYVIRSITGEFDPDNRIGTLNDKIENRKCIERFYREEMSVVMEEMNSVLMELRENNVFVRNDLWKVKFRDGHFEHKFKMAYLVFGFDTESISTNEIMFDYEISKHEIAIKFDTFEFTYESLHGNMFSEDKSIDLDSELGYVNILALGPLIHCSKAKASKFANVLKNGLLSQVDGRFCSHDFTD